MSETRSPEGVEGPHPVGPGSSRKRAAREAPRKRRTQDERSADSRLRVVEAAAKVLAEKRYAGLRMAEVSRVAKISRGGLLHHFPTKDRLLIATAEHVLRSGVERGLARTREPLASADPIEAIVRDSIDFFWGRDFGIILDLILTGAKRKAFSHEIEELTRKNRPRVESAWLEVLVEGGMPREEADRILWLTISIVRGLAVRALWQRDEPFFRSLLDEWRRILAGYREGVAGDGRSPEPPRLGD